MKTSDQITKWIRLVLAATLAVTLGVALTSSGPVAAAETVTSVDDAGPDDEPGQKDLNQLTVNYGNPGATTIDVTYNFDSLTTTGANTRDGCALFDTDGDGFANYAQCHTIASDDTQTVSQYDCTADSRSDRCGGPSAVLSYSSTSVSSNVGGSDPFRSEPSHTSGNTCKDAPACYTDDTVVVASIALADFGNPANASLINVCSYPSREPNSDPSDCVFRPNNGFLTIVKQTSESTTQQFDFVASEASEVGASSWSTTGAGAISTISYEPSTTLDLNESAVGGWSLVGSSCELRTATGEPTGTPTQSGIDDLEIRSGLETICTFSNARQTATLTVEKQWSDARIDEAVNITTTGGTNNVSFGAEAGTPTELEVDTTTYTVYPGETLTFDEAFVPDASVSSLYDTSLACSGAADTNPNDGLTIDLADTAITCTYTNARRGAQLVVRKQWQNAVIGDQVRITTSGGTNNADLTSAADTHDDLDAAAGVAVFAGDVISFDEQFLVGDQANYATTLGCTGAADPDPGDGLTVGAADTIITCTYTNPAPLGTIIVDKQAMGHRAGDDFSFTGALTGTIDGVVDSGDELTLQVPADTYTVTEAPSSDYELTNISCVDLSGGSSGDEQTRTATFDVAPGETVECTFTNVRNAAEITLAKTWASSFDGDAVELSVRGDDLLSTGPETVTSTAPTANVATTPLVVYSDETVTLSETFQAPADIDDYNTRLVCAGGQDVDTTSLTKSGSTLSYELSFGDVPVDTECAFVNDLKTTRVILQKEWVDGKAGDQAELVLATANPASTDAATSEATGASGAETDTSSQATLDVFVGQAVGLDEELLVGDGNYTYDLGCVGGNLTYTSGSATGSVEILASDENQDVICTFTNTRRTATLTLTKDWGTSPVSTDAVDLRIGPDGAELAQATSTANVPAATPAETTVFVGDSYAIAESFSSGTPGNYRRTWACDGAVDTNGSGQSASVAIAPADADGTVACTFTNDRLSTTLTFQKDWENGAPNDLANLTVTPQLSAATGPVSAVVPALGSGVSAAKIVDVTVYAGENVSLAEAFAADAVDDVDGTYDVSDFTCTAATNGVAGWGGAADLDATLTIDPLDTAPITCTVTNARRSAELTLVKTWDDPFGGTQLSIDASGDDANVGETINESTTSPAGASGSMTVFSGETITLSETFTDAQELDYFTSALDCGADDLATVERPDGTWTTSIAAGDDPQDLTCTFDNVRDRTQLRLAKSWVNSFAGDQYDLTITATDSDQDALPAVAPGGNGTSTETTEVTVYAGEPVNLTETPGSGNTGSYSVDALTCTAAGLTWVPGSATGTFDVDDTNVGTDPIVCTFTNERTSTTFKLVKTWDDPVGDSSVDLDSLGTDPIVRDPIAAATSTSNVASTTTATMTVFSGETVNFSETFADATEAGLFTTTLECNGDDPVAQTADQNGQLASSIDVPKTGLAPIMCTFDNVRKRTTLTLDKAWVAPAGSDTTTLSIDGTEDDSDTVVVPATDPVGGAVSTTVYAGEPLLTLAESFGASNLARYDVTSLDCSAGALTWVSGAASATLGLAADDVAAPIACTFENTARRGDVTITKSIDGVNDGTFRFAAAWPADGVTSNPAEVDGSSFSITTSGGTGSVVFFDVLLPKDGQPYSVTETDPSPNFDGTEVVCDGFSSVGRNNDGDLVGSVLPVADGNVGCTFTNTERSKIVIIKDARPDSAADFAFTGDLGAFILDDDADGTLSNTKTSGLLNAEAGSTYTINETSTPGWTLDTGLSSCSNQNPFAGSGVVVDPAPGTTVTCTFVNTADPAGLTATKAVDGVVGDWGPFTFTLTGGSADATFTGDADQVVDNIVATPPMESVSWTELVEGQLYTLTESQEDGYVSGAEFTCTVILPPATGATPFDDASTDAGFQFVAVAGAIYSCDITNVAIDPTLIVEKTTVGDTGSFTFDVTPTDLAYPVGPLTADTSVVNPAPTTTVDLQAGVGYAIAEHVSDEWVEGALTCTVTPAGGPQTSYVFDTITQPGDVISCEITNTKRARIIVEKKTVPAAAVGDFGFEASWNGAADGSADFTLADGVSENSGFIDPNVEYTVTELAASGFSLTSILCDPTGSGSVADSNAAVTPEPGDVVTCEFTNTERGQVTVDKDAVTAVTLNGTTYSVTYEITVRNQSYVDELYTVTDTPDMADNVTVTSMLVNGPGVSDLEIAPDGGVIITDGTLPARAGQGGPDDPPAIVYTVVTEFAMTPSNTNQDCVDATGGNGAYNGVTVTFPSPPTTDTDDACVDLPTPDIDVEKVADQPVATQIGDTFRYQADYTVTVTNSGEGPGSYTLTDLPTFGSGAADSVTITPQPDPVSNVLVAGGRDVYAVTVLFTVDGELPLDVRECGETPTPGQGGYNSATVTYGPTPNPTGDACVQIPDPNITVEKVATTDTATQVSGNTYDAVYTVTVDNIGDGPGAYSLADLPNFGAGANVVSTTIVPEPAALTPIEAGGQDVYTATVRFTVDGDMPVDERECAEEPTAGQGGYNGVTVTYNEGQTSTSNDCVDIPAPNVDDSKVVVGDAAVYNGDNSWTVTYQIDVTNLDPSAEVAAGPAEYDLTDTFDFGPGVLAFNVSVTPSPDTLVVVPGFDGDAQNVLADDTLINRNETHTYTVVVELAIVPTEGTNGDCDGQGGLRNSAGLSVSTDVETVRPDREACASFSTLTLIKRLAEESDGGNATVQDFTLTATLEADVILSGNTVVTESVPAGDYALTETQLPGYTTDGFVCGAAVMNGDTVTVGLGANVRCTIVNDDLAVDLALTKDDGDAEAVAGGAPFDYTISVRNIGTRDADAGEPVTVTDELPAGLVWVSFPANCSQAGQTLTCDLDPALLPAGGAAVVITASVRATAGAPSGIYVNKASVTTADDPVCEGVDCAPPPCPATQNNNVDCEETPVDREGGIQIIKTDDVADGESVQPGDSFTYRLVVTNTGVSTILPGLHVEDDLPAQLEFVSVSGGAGWTCDDAGPIDCDYAPELAPGRTAPAITITVAVVADAAGANIENVAVVLGAVDRDCPSATARLVESFAPACNQVTDDDDENTPLSADADLAIVKTASVAQVGAGGGFDWTLDITNNGPAIAENVVIGDLVPATLQVTGVSSSDFDCDHSGNDVECTIGSLAVGASGTVTIGVTVPVDAAGGDVTNVGTVESDTPDPDLSNNSDDATVTIVAQAPPTTTLPPVTLPKTGSDATQDIVRVAMLFLLLGGAVVLATRRRRDVDVVMD